jgi:hypothetical protein
MMGQALWAGALYSTLVVTRSTYVGHGRALCYDMGLMHRGFAEPAWATPDHMGDMSGALLG